jgi:hypothetical protein
MVLGAPAAISVAFAVPVAPSGKSSRNLNCVKQNVLC